MGRSELWPKRVGQALLFRRDGVTAPAVRGLALKMVVSKSVVWLRTFSHHGSFRDALQSAIEETDSPQLERGPWVIMQVKALTARLPVQYHRMDSDT